MQSSTDGHELARPKRVLFLPVFFRVVKLYEGLGGVKEASLEVAVLVLCLCSIVRYAIVVTTGNFQAVFISTVLFQL